MPKKVEVDVMEKAEIEDVIEMADDWYGESKLAKKYQNWIVASAGIWLVIFLAIAIPMSMEYGSDKEYIYEGYNEARVGDWGFRWPDYILKLSVLPDDITMNGVDIRNDLIKVNIGKEVPRGMVVGGIIVVFVAGCAVLWLWFKYRGKRIAYRNDLIMYWADHGLLMPPEDWKEKLKAEQEGKKPKGKKDAGKGKGDTG